MKKLFYSKIFIAISCFCLGFLTNHYFTKISQRLMVEVSGLNSSRDRIPVNPDDFDHDKLLEAARKMRREIINQAGHEGKEVRGVERREDDEFVYYDIPLNDQEKNDHQLKVKVNEGMITITEHTKNSESVREFSIEPGLDESKAEVIYLKDRISIKIPKTQNKAQGQTR